jgi:hypothetical protein
MSCNLEIACKEGYLHIRFCGAFSIAEALHAVEVMKDACSKENCHKVLFDCISMTGEMSIFDRYKIGEYGAEILPGIIKIAMLGREDQRLPDNFFENVVVNRGLTLKEFSDGNEAVGWLEE